MKVLVEAMGMASCLGPAVPACAAFRANLRQPSPALETQLALPGDEVPQPLTVCALPVATFGFTGVGRLVALTCEVLKDLGNRVDLETLGTDGGLYLALPDPWTRGLDLGEPDDTASRRIEVLGTRVLETSLRNLGLSWKGPRRFFGGGNVAFAQALHVAHAELLRRGLRACVVMGLDCLVEEPTLQALADENRLKTPDQPVGLTPGEAGAALLVTPDGPGAVSRVVLHGVRLGQEPHPRGSDRPSDGRALAECAGEVLAAAGAVHTAPLLVSDHNGEEVRAREWGMALLRLRELDPALATPPTWYPAIGFGDVGAATGAIATCVAARALQRGYAPSSHCLILSSADDAGRAAILLGAEPPPSSRGAVP
jgi:3-oxoacyl-[acyl-carrier-protein] synthase-1